MNCTNHPAVADGVTSCARCSNPFCADCLVRLEGRPFCTGCKAEQLADIRSGVNRSGEQLAGIGRRFAAIFIDSCVTQVPLNALFPAALGMPAFITLVTRPRWQSLITVGLLVVPILYEGAMLQWRGQTIGKMVLRVRVLQAGGQRISAGQSWIRAVVRGLFASLLRIIDYATAFFTKEKTCLHDLAARSRVFIIDFALNACPRCNHPIDFSSIATSPAVTCPSCAGTFEAVKFAPAPFDASLPQTVDASLEAAQPCALHTHNAAVVGCERCGSFICKLCRIDIDNRTLCPTCFERLAADGSLRSTRTAFRDYPGMAGVTAVLGFFMVFVGILFGPLAIYYGVMGLKQKKRMDESEGRGVLWVAIAFGAIELGISVLLLGFMFIATRSRF